MPTPKAKFDRKLIRTLASYGCTQEEIANACGISETTLKKYGRAELDAGYASMRRSLRRWQYEAARGGNTALLIWLGKQYLGQKDRHEQTVREEVVTIEEIEAKMPTGHV
jgi:transcriptional regulator with XRE-family HTH domain